MGRATRLGRAHAGAFEHAVHQQKFTRPVKKCGRTVLAGKQAIDRRQALAFSKDIVLLHKVAACRKVDGHNQLNLLVQQLCHQYLPGLSAARLLNKGDGAACSASTVI